MIEAKCDSCGNNTACEQIEDLFICPVCKANEAEFNWTPGIPEPFKPLKEIWQEEEITEPTVFAPTLDAKSEAMKQLVDKIPTADSNFPDKEFPQTWRAVDEYLDTTSQKVYSVSIPNLASDTQHLIAKECIHICRVILEKNRKYGDSALKPMRAFSKASADEQLKVRLDDKLTRLINRAKDEDEDVELDFIGYLILLRIWRQLQK